MKKYQFTIHFTTHTMRVLKMIDATSVWDAMDKMAEYYKDFPDYYDISDMKLV